MNYSQTTVNNNLSNFRTGERFFRQIVRRQFGRTTNFFPRWRIRRWRPCDRCTRQWHSQAARKGQKKCSLILILILIPNTTSVAAESIDLAQSPIIGPQLESTQVLGSISGGAYCTDIQPLSSIKPLRLSWVASSHSALSLTVVKGQILEGFAI